MTAWSVQSHPAAAGVFWLGVYLALVLAPLFVLLLGPTPPGRGFWRDLSAALGFAGLGMMGVQFLLTARFRRATAPFGIDIIYYFHRYLAYVILLIVAAHPVLIVAADPVFVHALNPIAAPWFMTAGVISFAALALLVATSAFRKRIGLAYEPWRAAHALLAVLAVGLALLHLEGVQYYAASAWKRALWRTFGLTWIAVLGYVRLVRPWQLLRRPYRVGAVAQERGDAWTLGLEPDGHRGFSFHPGQFAWLTIGCSPFRMAEHPFSISSAPGPGGRVEFTIKELGDFTRTVGGVRPGDLAYVDGPYGAFTVDRHRAPGYVFIAGGIGIAPIMSMLRALADRRDPRPVILFYAYRLWDRMTFRETIESLRSRLDLAVVLVLQEPPDGWSGERGWITREILERHLPADRAAREYFVCGPEAMTQAIERILAEMGVPMPRVHSELFDLV